MKLIVAGSRSITSYNTVRDAIRASGFTSQITEIVSGCAKGVDASGDQWAQINSIPVKRFPANWDKYGKLSGQMRNYEMAEYADALVAVWDGESRGTAHMIQVMRNLNKSVFIWQKCALCNGTGQIAVVTNAVVTGEANACSNCDRGWQVG